MYYILAYTILPRNFTYSFFVHPINPNLLSGESFSPLSIHILINTTTFLGRNLMRDLFNCTSHISTISLFTFLVHRISTRVCYS
uniref:Putative ovule protein n=1 Tax=Solanum chacoense TaxID=4108 RepID=A0A0V0GY85_SOLCH